MLVGMVGCSAAALPLQTTTAPAGSNAAVVARCLARYWEAEGFGVRVRSDGAGLRVEASGMPPSPRFLVTRTAPRLAADLRVEPGGTLRATLFAAPTLLGNEREAASFVERVAGCARVA